MVTFAVATPAKEPRIKNGAVIAWAYAAVLVVMTVGQLFGFEDFIPLIQGYGLPGGLGTATAIAGLLVVGGVMALPFLLRMPLSPLMRWVSMFSGLLVPAIWVVLAITSVVKGEIANSGLVGTEVTLPGGWLFLVISLLIAVLGAVSAIGLWPPSISRKN